MKPKPLKVYIGRDKDGKSYAISVRPMTLKLGGQWTSVRLSETPICATVAKILFGAGFPRLKPGEGPVVKEVLFTDPKPKAKTKIKPRKKGR